MKMFCGLMPSVSAFVARRLELLALAEIGGEGHDLAAVGGLQPFEDDRGVEPAGIGQHDFLDVFLAVLGIGKILRSGDRYRPKCARTIGGRWTDASAARASRALSDTPQQAVAPGRQARHSGAQGLAHPGEPASIASSLSRVARQR